MKKINLAMMAILLSGVAHANYQKHKASVINHSYVSTPKNETNNECACANKKKKSIINKDREKKFVSAMFNSVKESTALN